MEEIYRDPALLEKELERNSVRKIALKCGVSVQIVYAWMKAFNLTPPSKRVERPYRNRAWLEKKVQQGMTPKKIASLCNVYSETILNWMHIHNLPTPRPKKPWHCDISPEMIELFDGLLLGGGALLVGHWGSSAYFVTRSETIEYLKWVQTRLESLGISQVRIGGRDRKAKKQALFTGAYCELLPIYKRWYRKRKKNVPQDFSLTSDIALCWFLRGGHLEISDSKTRKAIRIWIDRYSRAGRRRLIEELVKIGIHPSLYVMKRGTMIRIAESPLFLDYIGECPHELREPFGYRWNIIRER